MNKCNLIISLVIIPFFLQAQEISYSIKAELDSKEKIIKVNQKMKFLKNDEIDPKSKIRHGGSLSYLKRDTMEWFVWSGGGWVVAEHSHRHPASQAPHLASQILRNAPKTRKKRKKIVCF